MELLEKSEHLNQILNSIREKLKSGGKPAFIGKLFKFIQPQSFKIAFFFFLLSIFKQYFNITKKIC